MPGRWLALVVVLTAILGCGKKPAKPDDTGGDKPAPRLPGPGPITPPKKEPPKVDFDVLMSDMKTFAGKMRTDTAPSGSTTLSKLTAAFPPGHERSADIYKAMVETANKLEAKDRSQYVYWAARYAGKENINDLLGIARGYVNEPATCSAAFTRLAELKDPSTFPALAAMLNDNTGLLRLESARAIRAIGAPAEKAVQPYAVPLGPDGKPNDFLLRAQAVSILGDIGTAASLPVLQMVLKEGNSTMTSRAQTSIDQIQSRMK